MYPQNPAASSGGFQFLNQNPEGDGLPPARFDYSTYMQNLQQKLAEHQGAGTANWGVRGPSPGRMAHLDPAVMASPDVYGASRL